MHEAGLARSILRTALGSLPRPNAGISKIVVVAGALSAVERESLEMYFHELSRNTAADGAALEIRFERAKLVCRACGNEMDFDAKQPVIPICEKCGGHNHLTANSGVYVDSMEIEG